MALSPDGKYLVTGSGGPSFDDKKDYTVNLIEVESRTILHKFDNIHSGNNN